MNEFKGTPGPWEVGTSKDESKYVYCDDSLGSAICQFDLDHTIALTKDVKKANAHLIASSPELLEACLTVVSGYEGDGMEQMGARDEVFYKYCKQAINKALGLQIK